MATSAQASLAIIARFFRWMQWGVVALGLGWLLGRLSPVLTPFVIAAMLGWLGDPLVDRIEARGASRNTAVFAVFTVMTLALLLLLLILVPLVVQQVTTLVQSWPEYQRWFDGWFSGRLAPWVEQNFHFDLVAWFEADHLLEMLRQHWQSAGGVAVNLLGFVSRSGLTMMLWAANVVLIPVLAFFFLRDWDRFVERIAALVPRDHIDTVTRLARESDEVLGGFLRGQFLVMAALGVLYGVGLWLAGIKVGILIGIIGGLLSFVPYLGPASVVVMATVAALVQGLGWQGLAGVAVVFTVAQLIESYLLTPKLVGERIGLHPMAVIFAVMAGGVMFGFLGMLLALPAAAVINVLLRFAVERYRASRAYVGEGPAIVVGDERRVVATVDSTDSEPPQT
ncbi:AI-2E family transporter [Luteimonas sp. e5]